MQRLCGLHAHEIQSEVDELIHQHPIFLVQRLGLGQIADNHGEYGEWVGCGFDVPNQVIQHHRTILNGLSVFRQSAQICGTPKMRFNFVY